MRKLLSILSFAAVFFCSCSSSSDSNIKYTYESIDLNDAIDKAQAMDKFSIDDLIDTIKVIKLQTTDKSIMGPVWKVVLTDENIYVLSISLRDVLIFNKNGEFIKKISRGPAPGELTQANDICYDFENNELLILQNNYVNRYTPQGDYIDWTKTRKSTCSISKTANGFVSYCVAPYLGEVVYSLDSSHGMIDAFNINSPISNSPLQHYLFQSSDGGVNIARYFDNYIYCFKNDTLALKYIIDYSKYAYEPSVINKGFFEPTFKYDESKFFFTGSFHETQNYEIFTIANCVSANYLCVRNKKSKNIRLCNYLKYESTQNNIGYLAMQGSQFTYGDYFFTYVCFDGMDADRKAKLLSMQPCNQLSQADADKIKSLTDDDNPLIVLYKLKGLE